MTIYEKQDFELLPKWFWRLREVIKIACAIEKGIQIYDLIRVGICDEDDVEKTHTIMYNCMKTKKDATFMNDAIYYFKNDKIRVFFQTQLTDQYLAKNNSEDLC